MPSFFARLLGILLLACAQLAPAASLRDGGAVPQLDSSGGEGYRAFLAAEGHRAFAIGAGGVWAWRGSGRSAEAVARESVAECEATAGRRCILYALDDKVVFDSKTWSGLWGPYFDSAAAARAPYGLNPGARFHDLAVIDPAGRPFKLSDLRGKVVVLHFWGSWCPSCRRELPELQQLQAALGPSSDIRLVLLQIREEIAESRRWAKQQGLQLPLYDSGAGRDENLPLANGKSIPDRSVAQVFPTTYVLDKHGIILFSHTGPVARWPQYLPLLRDAANRSGK